MMQNEEEMVRGYIDGLRGNQAASMGPDYQHGWENGIADREKNPTEEQRAHARAYLDRIRIDER